MFKSIGQNKISQKHQCDNFNGHTIQKKYLILIHEHIFLQTIIPLVVMKSSILLSFKYSSSKLLNALNSTLKKKKKEHEKSC